MTPAELLSAQCLIGVTVQDVLQVCTGQLFPRTLFVHPIQDGVRHFYHIGVDVQVEELPLCRLGEGQFPLQRRDVHRIVLCRLQSGFVRHGVLQTKRIVLEIARRPDSFDVSERAAGDQVPRAPVFVAEHFAEALAHFQLVLSGDGGGLRSAVVWVVQHGCHVAQVGWHQGIPVDMALREREAGEYGKYVLIPKAFRALVSSL